MKNESKKLRINFNNNKTELIEMDSSFSSQLDNRNSPNNGKILI
jgi:hypothetical protein